MKSFKFPANISITLVVASLMVIFTSISNITFPLLSLERNKIVEGELWRLFTSNFVHFGWAHTLMNLAAFLICAFAFLHTFSATRLLSLIVFCSVIVGIGVYALNPEYETYAGLSGAIHGFFVAGLLLNRRNPYWINGVFIVLTFAKIIYEHQANYKSTELQALLPVPVAYDAHLYGALAGLVFGTGALIVDHLVASKRKTI